jgi:hypothetical protein
MISILRNSHNEFMREVQIAIELVQKKEVVKELIPFKQWILSYYNSLHSRLEKEKYYIELNESTIFSNIFNNLAQLQRGFRVINSKFLSSLHRHREEEILSLRILEWLHSIHTQTTGKPFLIVDGDFGILPTVDLPVTYYFPVTSQFSLLHTPLFFHELGHYLYKYHKDEMDALVKEFQKKLESRLTLPFQTNDANSENELKKNKIIIETWYEWMQELFCDAVGLEMGGSTYLKTFSQYLRIGGRTTFFVPENDLAKRSHPVTTIRIKFLVMRAKKLGLEKEAILLEKEWSTLVQALGINEEYYGYYLDSYAADISSTLNDMITEASPMKFSDFASPVISEFDSTNDNFLQLIFLAWKKYEDSPADYHKWESDFISAYIDGYLAGVTNTATGSK